MKDVILVIGSSGQIGTDLVIELRKIHGSAKHYPVPSFPAAGSV